MSTFTEELTLGERLARARNHAGMSQGRLAAELGCHPRSMVNYEAGNRKISLDLACRWAAATGVPLDYFADGVGVTDWLLDPHYAIVEIGPDDVIDLRDDPSMPFHAAVAA